MSKSIADRANVSASVILNKKGEHVATVRYLYGTGGAVYCEVWQCGEAAVRSLATALKTGRVSLAKVENLEREAKYCSTPEDRRRYVAHDLFAMQSGRASGYGYDKATAALSGIIIDGHTMANHCGHVPEDERARARLFAAYEKSADSDYTTWRDKAKRIGCRFANYGHGKDGRASSLYFDSGTERLSALGYHIISAI